MNIFNTQAKVKDAYERGFGVGFSAGYQACENNWSSFVIRYEKLQEQIEKLTAELKQYKINGSTEDAT